MTGYGLVSGLCERSYITIELKSLNGKQRDVRAKIAQRYRDQDIALRNRVLERAGRGRYELNVTVLIDGSEEPHEIHEDLFRHSYRQLQRLGTELGTAASEGSLVEAVLRIPGITGPIDEQPTEEELTHLHVLLDEAIDRLIEFREREGAPIAVDLRHRVENIKHMMEAIAPHALSRIDKVRERLRSQLEELIDRAQIDENRFEQEIIYYIERLDINEEQQRLAEHCDYFIQLLDDDQLDKGRRLGFVAQEMGREINTLGSKAQHADIQRLVIGMKDELEKIKEQTANIV